MTDTENLSKLFPADTAAGRIHRSVRVLTEGFSERLLALEAHPDKAVVEEAVAMTNRVSASVYALNASLRVAARFMTRQGVEVEGRNLAEEERALARVLAELHQLTQSEWPMTAEVRELLGSRDVRWAQGHADADL